MSDDKIEFEGVIKSARGNGLFTIEIQGLKEKTEVSCTLSGKIKKNNIRVLEGDRVKIEISPYDLSKGRITYRIK
jgi:translation initiation factor IF-1